MTATDQNETSNQTVIVIGANILRWHLDIQPVCSFRIGQLTGNRDFTQNAAGPWGFECKCDFDNLRIF